MAAFNDRPIPWHIPYSTVNSGDYNVPEFLGWVGTSGSEVVNLPKISTDTRNMCIGAVLIIENQNGAGLYLKAADGDTIEGEQYAFLGEAETGHVVATPNGDWSLVYVWVVNFGARADATMPAAGKIAAISDVESVPAEQVSASVNIAVEQQLLDVAAPQQLLDVAAPQQLLDVAAPQQLSDDVANAVVDAANEVSSALDALDISTQ